MADYTEKGHIFRCKENRLVGISTVPEKCHDVGVLIVVGGPQYRVGSHRQFALLARSLAAAGIPSFRFDCRGMGDSEGRQRSFHEVQDDIFASLDEVFELLPKLSSVVVWGLCDAASAALLFGFKDSRISGLVLLNPWVHSGDYSPEVRLSHYYAPLLKGGDVWRRLFTGKIPVFSVLKEIAVDTMVIVKKMFGRSYGVPARHDFVRSMLEGMLKFSGPILFILSEQDLTAREFLSLTTNENGWKRAMEKSGVTLKNISEADHTFSKKIWQDEVAQLTIDSVNKGSKS